VEYGKGENCFIKKIGIKLNKNNVYGDQIKYIRLKYSVGHRFCTKISIWSSYFY